MGKKTFSYKEKVLHYYTTLLIVHLQIFGTLKGTEKTIKDKVTKRYKREKNPHVRIINTGEK